MIPESEWIWQGHAGHFIGWAKCGFRLATTVGDYLISTVGDYSPKAGVVEDIGCDRKFETFVFEVSGRQKCGCAVIDNWTEVDALPANDAATATENHMRMCRKAASGAVWEPSEAAAADDPDETTPAPSRFHVLDLDKKSG